MITSRIVLKLPEYIRRIFIINYLARRVPFHGQFIIFNDVKELSVFARERYWIAHKIFEKFQNCFSKNLKFIRAETQN